MEPSLDESEFATRVFGDLGEVRANPHDLETATVSAVVDGRPDVSCDRNVIDSMDGGAGGWKDGAKNMVVAQDHPLDAQVKVLQHAIETTTSKPLKTRREHQRVLRHYRRVAPH